MTSKGYSRKPCPACGESGYFIAERICRDCQQLLKEARDHRASVDTDPEWRPYRIPHAHWPIDLYRYGSGQHDRRTDYKRVVELTLYNLMLAVGKDAPAHIKRDYSKPGLGQEYPDLIPSPHKHPNPSDHERTARRLLMQPAVADLIADLVRNIREYAAENYDKGYQDGQNLLVGLASGTMSVADFNQRSVVGGGKR